MTEDNTPYSGPERVLGVDVGGTFTDFILWEGGRIRTYKRPSTPSDPSSAILAGITEAGLELDELVHGSTVATNTVLTRRGVSTAFITTKGFRDILRIGRQSRALADLYNLSPQPTQTLVPVDLSFEADERVTAEGQVLGPLTEEDARRVIAQVRASGVDSVAVCLLFSFLVPDHELTLKRIAEESGLQVSVSHEILPEVREYERASTTVINAYVRPIMARYLDRLQTELRAQHDAPLRMMLSDGTTVTGEVAGERAVRTILSGPAAGVIAAFDKARELGYDKVLSFDMGGTSTDVAYCFEAIPLRRDALVGGLPIGTPTLDVHSVGAGGGSVAYVDEAGALRVGPQSAGAEPGPAAYARGGPATVTDAQVVLGRVPPDRFLGGRMTLDLEAARVAVSDVAEKLDIDTEAAAAAIIDVAVAEMERAVRRVTVERGYDPRDAVLFAFGGAGPLHACDLADAFGITRVVVPPHPGLLSALGLVIADTASDDVLPVHRPISGDLSNLQTSLNERVAGLAERLGSGLDHNGPAPKRELFVALRYSGQSHDLLLTADTIDLAELRARFDELHQQRFGHHAPEQPVEVVSVRVRVSTRSGRSGGRSPEGAAGAAATTERLWMKGSWVNVPSYSRYDLTPGTSFDGPALIHQMDATTVISPGWGARVENDVSLILEVS